MTSEVYLSVQLTGARRDYRESPVLIIDSLGRLSVETLGLGAFSGVMRELHATEKKPITVTDSGEAPVPRM